ncbi:MAG: lysylphosphatidylglycerol synthase transmembrane domain-containing protein, partial [Candidatus Gracilibacteria bacterium]|nr:lysylphosphatidylglycerol synthase transmembrane domain-containing protein [Candidatus Gracilibacteria bacterium]
AFIAFVASGIFVVSFTNLIPKNSLHLFSALIVVFVGLSIYVFKKLLDGEGFLTTLFNGLRLNKVKKLQRFEKKIHRTENLITKFLNHSQHKRSTLPIIIGLSLLGWAFTIGEYYMLARFVGVGLGGYESFLIATIPSVAYLLPMPAGLGMLESAQVGLFSLLGYSAGSALAVMVMVRVKELFFSGVGFAYALTHGLTLLGKESTKKQFVKGPTGLKPRKITRIGIKKILQQTKASV